MTNEKKMNSLDLWLLSKKNRATQGRGEREANWKIHNFVAESALWSSHIVAVTAKRAPLCHQPATCCQCHSRFNHFLFSFLLFFSRITTKNRTTAMMMKMVMVMMMVTTPSSCECDAVRSSRAERGCLHTVSGATDRPTDRPA